MAVLALVALVAEVLVALVAAAQVDKQVAQAVHQELPILVAEAVAGLLLLGQRAALVALALLSFLYQQLFIQGQPQEVQQSQPMAHIQF